MIRTWSLALAAALMPALAACAAMTGLHEPPLPLARAAAADAARTRPLPAAGIIGVAAGSPASWAAATGKPPALVVSYLSMGQPATPAQFMTWTVAAADGAVPLIEILPKGISLTSIAAGRHDRWFRRLGAAIRRPVVLSFAPEADGNWYSYGRHPRRFIAAWRHVVTVLHSRFIKWMWQQSARQPHPARYWPGSRYVTWAGLDGYFYGPADTFKAIFGPAIAALRKVTTRPILISETSVGPLAGRHVRRDIRSLAAAVAGGEVIGLVWFDGHQHDPPIHQDWNLESRPRALAEFRAAFTSV
jgi:hypothetical protein